MNWRDRLRILMEGRYGVDNLAKVTMTGSLIFIIVAMFTASIPSASTILDLLGIALLGITYFRMMSRDFGKRQSENQMYLNKTAKIRHLLGKEKYMMDQRKTFHIYTCPGCGQKIRAPKGKGKIEISCPKCQTKFVKRS